MKIDINRLQIRYVGDPILRKTGKKIEVFDEDFKSFMLEFVSLMYKWDGVGLAAPQAGINKRFFVMDDGNEQKLVVNPEIVEHLGDEVEFEEGCLSVPDIYAKVIRPEGVKVKYQDIEGNLIEEELHDYTARIFQHEYDHLDGKLFTDKLSVMQKAKIKKALAKIIKDGKKRAKDLGEVEM